MDFNANTKLHSIQNEPIDLNRKYHIKDIDKYTYFLEKPHKNLYCPVCFNLFKNPTLIDCSHTICDQCIESDEKVDGASNKREIKCPLDGKICTIKLSNKHIAEQIDDLLIRYLFFE